MKSKLIVDSENDSFTTRVFCNDFQIDYPWGYRTVGKDSCKPMVAGHLKLETVQVTNTNALQKYYTYLIFPSWKYMEDYT